MNAMNLTLHVWRQPAPDAAGRDGALRGARHQPGHVVPRDARRRERAADRAGRGADRLRSRLPRGHLRLVRPDDQRRRARARAGAPPPASSTCGASSDGDEIYDRAVARAGLPGDQGPGGGPRARSTGSSRPAASSRAPTGSAPDANAIPIPKRDVDTAMDAAACIGCGACVAACPNASASLFTAAKVTHLGLLPQGQPERYDRARADGRADGRRGLRRTARSTASARRRAPRRSASTRSRG